MIQIEQIKAEIKRRMLEDYNSSDAQKDEIAQGVCAGILTFINSLPQEEVSDDLMEAANGYAFDLDTGDLNTNRDTFIAGANWQKEQMLRDAIGGEVQEPESLWWRIVSDDLEGGFILRKDLRDGDRVKLIIVKEEQV